MFTPNQLYGLLIVGVSLLIFIGMFIDAGCHIKSAHNNDSRPQPPKGSAKL